MKLTPAGALTSRLVGTDDDGRFRFDALPAGRYTLSASKPGYVLTFHGSRHPGRGPGVPVAVADGQRVEITLRILPGAVIAGTITDAQGNPAPGVPVAAVETRPVAGAPLAPARATTDDLGMYRLYGLAPGEYLVSASPQLTDGRGLPGSGGAVPLMTASELQWARSGGGAGGPPPSPGRSVAYAPVFYPGTTNAADAAVVRVASGEERSGVGMALRIVPMARVAGTLVDTNGQAVTIAQVTLYPRRAAQPSPADVLVSSGAVTLPRATVSAAGFVFSGVAPGEYTLVARTGSGQRGAPPPTASPPITLWNVTDLVVDGNDRSDLSLRLLPGLMLSGSIAFDRTTLTPPSDLSTVDLSLLASNPIPGVAVPRGVVSPTGTFKFSSVAPGAYILRATAPGAAPGVRWTLKSALVNSRDLADRPIDAKATGEEVGDLVVTFTDRAGEISGRVIDAADQPVSRYSIVVFTTDKSLWLPNARRIQTAQPATDGAFSISGLAAGEYAIAAVGDTAPGDLADPAFLSQILASAFKVTLADGEKKRQDLRVAK